MKILGIDTSSASLSLGVIDDNVLKGEFTLNHKLTHSENLMPLMDNLLKSLDLTPKDIDIIGVSIGPGSFTGIRIGVSAANAMAMGLSIDVVGISSLEAMAYGVKYYDGAIFATLDAQRERVYRGIYSFEDEELKCIKEPDVVELEDLKKEAASYDRPLILGDASLMDEDVLNYFKCPRADEMIIKASSVCHLAKLYHNEGKAGFADPVYLRKSQAEIQFEERNKTSEL